MSIPSHTVQAQSNQARAQHLAALHIDPAFGKQASRQWRMTLHFYIAVHHVEKQLQKNLYSPSTTHQIRKRNLRNRWHYTQPDA